MWRVRKFCHVHGKHDVRKWRTEKVNDVYSNISYKLIFPENQGNNRSYKNITWNYSLSLIIGNKGVIIGEVSTPPTFEV